VGELLDEIHGCSFGVKRACSWGRIAGREKGAKLTEEEVAEELRSSATELRTMAAMLRYRRGPRMTLTTQEVEEVLERLTELARRLKEAEERGRYWRSAQCRSRRAFAQVTKGIPPAMPRNRLSGLLALLGVLAIAGWIWALSDEGMPDALWVVTVILSVAAILLALYMLAARRRTVWDPVHQPLG
jgi:hypothetical protein